MGIPEGITLIVGGGFHGKSTLLQALQVRRKSPSPPVKEPCCTRKETYSHKAPQMGVYDHIPGDGRELVVSSSCSFAGQQNARARSASSRVAYLTPLI